MKKRGLAAVAAGVLLSLGCVMVSLADEEIGPGVTGAAESYQGADSGGAAAQGTDSGGAAAQGTDSGGAATQGTDSGGAAAQGTDSGGAASQGADFGGAGPQGTDSGGAASQGTDSNGSTSQETVSGSAESTEEAYEWLDDGFGWKYVAADGTYKRNCWEKINGYWFHFDREGYMASEWTKVGGYYYCFRETGDLAVGWCFNDENEKWYYFDEDGFAKKGWFQDDDGSWYWFTGRGEMVSSGYRTIDGQRYYFLENGQMAANQYVGLYYMDENGQRQKEYDIVVEGKGKESSVSASTKNEITAAMQNIPRGWVKYFVEHGWEILYYPDKGYFSAPETGNGRYYVYYKLDTSYRKIKFCKPQGLTAAFGEYIGYASNVYGENSEFASDIYMDSDSLASYVDVPDYYSDDMKFYFGKLVEAYLSDSETRTAMEEDSPYVIGALKEILHLKDEKKEEAED